jgi:RNA polymerase sigma-70 factor (ECF subfamily)
MVEVEVSGSIEVEGLGDAPRASRARPARVLHVAERSAPRVRAMVDAHHPFIWRSLRRMGVPPAQVDDAVQEVFCVAHRRLDDILPDRERAFLFSVALHVAADARRRRGRSRECADEAAIDAAVSALPTPEEALHRRRLRAQLDEVLDALGADTRAVFVLVELEGMSAPEIAAFLSLPLGTVTSRLRRGREQFHAAAKRLRARAESTEGRR